MQSCSSCQCQTENSKEEEVKDRRASRFPGCHSDCLRSLFCFLLDNTCGLGCLCAISLKSDILRAAADNKEQTRHYDDKHGDADDPVRVSPAEIRNQIADYWA